MKTLAVRIGLDRLPKHPFCPFFYGKGSAEHAETNRHSLTSLQGVSRDGEHLPGLKFDGGHEACADAAVSKYGFQGNGDSGWCSVSSSK